MEFIKSTTIARPLKIKSIKNYMSKTYISFKKTFQSLVLRLFQH